TRAAFSIRNVSRRAFIRGIGASGGLILSRQFGVPRAARAPPPPPARPPPHGRLRHPHSLLRICSDGIVSILAARAEMGTGAARTALPMIVADELEADWARVKVVQAPGDEKTYGNQDTDGSRSVRHFIQPMRQCGAAARQMLEAAAAKK